ncbi:MAG: hypothetical protein GX061_08345 [Eubacteriaceae bacterium]|nr:hypothetical protein [Eubacteriaceae bacterium]
MKNDLINLAICIEILVIIEFIAPEGRYEKHIKTASAILFVCCALLPLISYITFFTSNDWPSFFSDEPAAIEPQTEGIMEDWVSERTALELREDFFSEIRARGIAFEGDIRFEITSENFAEGISKVSATVFCDKNYNPESVTELLIGEYSLARENIHIAITETGGEAQ